MGNTKKANGQNLRSLSFVESRNRRFRKDGDEFMRQADYFHTWSLENRDMSITLKAVDRDPAAYLYRHAGGIKFGQIAFFCHGTKKALIGCQSNIWSVDKMANAIKGVTDKEITICLYSCSTAKGSIDEVRSGIVPASAGYAMRLAGALYMRDVKFKIIAHDRSGHTTRNPFKVGILSDMSAIYKVPLIPYVSWWGGRKNPTGRRLWLKWVKALRETDLRWECAFMTRNQILDRLNEEK